VVEGAGHLLQEDSPETVVATVLAALDAVPA
jgi:pimeloyl-ACP methyl ester carboxylesterase